MKKLTLILSTVLLMASSSAMAASKRQLLSKIELLEFQIMQCNKEVSFLTNGGGARRNRKIGHVCTLELDLMAFKKHFTSDWAKLPGDAKRNAIQKCVDAGFGDNCNNPRYQKFKCTKSKR